MNERKYLLIDVESLLGIIKVLRSIDGVNGFDNMNRLVGAVDLLQKLVINSPGVNPAEREENEQIEDPELKAAADAARAEEEARK